MKKHKRLSIRKEADGYSVGRGDSHLSRHFVKTKAEAKKWLERYKK